MQDEHQGFDTEAVHAGTEAFLSLGWLDGAGPWLEEPQRLAKLPLLLLGVGLLVSCWRRRVPLPRVGFWFLGFFLAAAPTVHPWSSPESYHPTNPPRRSAIVASARVRDSSSESVLNRQASVG